MSAHMDALRGGPKYAAAILAAYRKQTAETRAAKGRTEAWRAEQLAVIKSWYQEQLRDLKTDLTGSLEQARVEIAGHKRGVPLTPTAQMGQQAAWARAKSLMDAKLPYGEIIRRAVKEGDAVTLHALKTELSSYLEAQVFAEYGTQREGHLIAEGEGALAAKLLDGALYNFLEPEQQQAMSDEAELASGWHQTQMTLGFIEQELTDPHAIPVRILPDWSKGASFEVAPNQA